MNDIIKIEARHIGGGAVQTVNGRELHEFLEVSKDFSDWVKAQIERARLVEGRDYVVLPQKGGNLLGGRPRVDYHFTIDAGKHIAMMSGTEKGFEVREYFIACERRVKAVLQAPVTVASVAAKAFPALFRVARLIGCDKNAAAISANQMVRRLTDVNLLEGLGQTHLEAANQEAQFFTPTELGKRIGTSARGVNLLLAEAGMQMKRGDVWEVTDAGREHARIYDTGKRHGSGVPIQQIKWAPAVLGVLGDAKEAA